MKPYLSLSSLTFFSIFSSSVAAYTCSTDNSEYQSLSGDDKTAFDANIRMLMTNEFTRFALGRDTAVDDKDLRKLIPDVNPELLELRKLASDRIKSDEIKNDAHNSGKYLAPFLSRKFSTELGRAFICSIESLRKSESNLYNRYLSAYIYQLNKIERVSLGRVGYFEVSTRSCSVMKSVKTNNRFSDLPAQAETSYIVLDASFKNLDSESRMPVEGDIIIVSNGKEYRFETSETVMAEGYGLRFRKMNPLITERTKLVYKVPDEISGEVYWEPGRNKDSIRLWCTYL